MIQNSGGAQTLNVGNLSVHSGPDYSAAGIVNSGTTQSISAGTVSVGTSAGSNNLNAPLAGDGSAVIANTATARRHLNTGAITVK